MRGKNILWLTMIAVLVSVSFINIGYTQDELPILALSPETIRNEDMSIPYFTLDVTVTNVEDLWGYGFTLDFAPFTSVLNILAVVPGPWFSEGLPYWPTPGWGAWFTENVDTSAGELFVGCTRNSDIFETGITGSGLLCTMYVAVVEAGPSTLDLVDTDLIDSMQMPMPHEVVSSNYIGPWATMKHPHGQIATRTVHPGDVQQFRMRVQNPSPVPLYVKVRFTNQHDSGDGAYVWSGQTYTGLGPNAFDYLYVDGYIDIGLNDWTLAGPPEALIGEPDGVYIESDTHCSLVGFYTFENFVLGARLIEDVDLEAYSKCQYTGPDIDSYVYTYDEYGNPVGVQSWGDSQGGTNYWAWTKGKYYDGSPYDMPQYYDPYILTEQGVNDCELLLHNYGGGSMQIDAYRLEVTYSKLAPVIEAVYVIQPGQTIDIEPATWLVCENDIGEFHCSATLHYSYYGTWFIRSHNPPAFTYEWTCLP